MNRWIHRRVNLDLLKPGRKALSVLSGQYQYVVSCGAVFRDVTQRPPFLSGERCVTSLKTAAKETNITVLFRTTSSERKSFFLFIQICHVLVAFGVVIT